MPLDRAWLERAAGDYLQRYATTEQNLRRVLRRRIRRAVAKEGGDVQALDAQAAGLVARLVAAGAVNDTAFVRSRVLSMLRRGKSLPAIRNALLTKGARAEDVEPVLSELTPQARLRTVVQAAKRMKIGPFHADPEGRRERRAKELAKLGRRGFRYEEASRVLDLEDVAMLDDLLKDDPL